MNGGHRQRVRAWLVLLVAIGALLGHVCTMPLHAHAEEAASATAGSGGHDDSDDHVVYHASCEALRTAPAQLTPSVMMSSTIVRAPVPVARETARVAASVFRAESPPLFLLHAALLI
jgi:hypothetical protein